MENPDIDAPGDETFAQALAALKRAYGVSDSEISRRIGTHHSTVSNWANGNANPRAGAIRKLAQEFPKFTEKRLFAAVGKRAPAPLSPDRRERLDKIFDRLTEEQQEMLLIMASAAADSNEQAS